MLPATPAYPDGAPPTAPVGTKRGVRFGVDGLYADPSRWTAAARVGMVTNDAARCAEDVSLRSRVALLTAGVPIVRLFSPEHGLETSAADGDPVGDGIDRETGLPVVSLYGARLHPDAASLGDLDALLFDVPDVGVRFYTYTWTLYHALSACEGTRTRLVVLDRPNPLGGDLALAEGPLLEPACRSFVGEDDIPIRHQLTLGELARLWQRERFPAAALTVVPCTGWRRDMPWSATGLPWVPTSPSMPTASGALPYAGTCLFEATNVSVARGTDAPFVQIGAPWMQSEAVIAWFQRRALLSGGPEGAMGAHLEAVAFTPTLAPHAGVSCCGVRVAVTDVQRFRPVEFGLLLLAAVAATHAGDFAWARYPTAANPGGGGHLDRLVGRTDVAAFLRDSPERVERALVQRWTDARGWRDRVAGVLCYD